MPYFFFYFRRLVLVFIVFSVVVIPFFRLKFFPQESMRDLISMADESPENQTNVSLSFFENKNTFEMNGFEAEGGLFSFQHLNHLTVKHYENIYYLQDLKNKRVVFQIFENQPYLKFDAEDFDCFQYTGPQSVFYEKEICFTHSPPEGFVANLKLFDHPYRFFNRQLTFFANKNLVNPRSFGYYDFFSRAEAVRFVLSLRYPQRDFSAYANDCFEDIGKSHPLSGYLCFAKSQGILVGIGGHLYPEQSINLHGLLKILFMTFEIKDTYFDERYLDDDLFEQMQKIHLAYPLIAKAYYEGIFLNSADQIHWANRHIYHGEAIEIIHRFLQWKEGRRFKKYESVPAFTVDTRIYSKKQDFSTQFEVNEDEAFDDNDLIVTVKLVQSGFDTEVYFLDRGGIYRYLYILEGTSMTDLKEVFVAFDVQRLKGKMIIIFKDGTKQGFKLKRKKIDFTSLKSDFMANGYVDSINKLEAAHLLPNVTPSPDQHSLPVLKLYMGRMDFENIFVHRTGNNRYPAWLEIHYPDGSSDERSILIKTRGNANRGYIKSGFTIESFVDFEEADSFEGDEFLEEADEFKLRGFINEETMIHEKLFYQRFAGLNYSSPDFFDATLEINGIPLGFYQVTEAIKEEFFERRDLNVEDFYYARNSGSIYNTNLRYYENDEITLSQYKYNSNPERLIQFIKRLEADDETLMNELNVRNIFDYALSVFLMAANDSLTHNFYLYFDENTKQWNIFPWDADDSLNEVRPFNIWSFLKFTDKNTGTYNHLIYYLFNHLSFEEIQAYMENYRERWNQLIPLSDAAQAFLDRNRIYYDYDNRLWNGKFLERKQYIFNTAQAIETLKKQLTAVDELSRQGIGFKNEQ